MGWFYLHLANSSLISDEDKLLPKSSHSFLCEPSSLRQSHTVIFEPQLDRIKEANKIAPKIVITFFIL